MKSILKGVCVLIISFYAALSLNAQNGKAKVVPNQYIMLLKNDFHQATTKMGNHSRAKTREARAEIFKSNSAALRTKLESALTKAGVKEFKLINVTSGANNYASIKLAAAKDMKIIQKLKWVKKITPDLKFRCISIDFDRIKINTQEVDWGIPDIGAENSSGVGKCAFVCDSGIFGKHPDLNVNKALSTSFVPAEPAYKDNNGHGTHVAGIIAAKDNSIGVKGVAAGATVIGVKVLDGGGNGTWSQIISGSAYVAAIALAGDVVNYSLEGPAGGATDALLQTEINAIANAGMFVSIAAGNGNTNANGIVPAFFNNTNVYTVSAYDSNYNIASFSNFGNGPVDFAAPGVNILSCDIKKNGYYSTKSGTSMAAPYVAGILLVNNGVINNSGTVASDKDATLDLKARL